MKGVVERESLMFPASLFEVEPKVERLFFKGDWEAVDWGSCVAIVGSRKMSRYGAEVTGKLVAKLVSEGKVIVSGMMYGIDQAAHSAALDCEGRTVAVLGYGIDMRESGANLKLRERIEKEGLVISEWGGEMEAAKWTFPMRNRIVAGLCSDVYIVEGEEKSGTMISAAWAEKYGRNLWAVPGPLMSRLSEGPNKLISEGRARPVWDLGGVKPKATKLSDDEERLLKILVEGMGVDGLTQMSGLGVEKVSQLLTMLILKGVIKESEGKYYLRK